MELRILNLAIGLGLVVWSIIWWKQNHGAELYAAPVLLFGLHVVAFHTITILRASGYAIGGPSANINTWSNGLRLHGLFTVILVACALKQFRRRVI